MEVDSMETVKDDVGCNADKALKRPSSSPETVDKTGAKSEITCQEDEAGEVEAANRKKLRTMQGSPSVGDDAGSQSPAVPEKLEVPSKELQCIQKQVLIEKLMGTNPTDGATVEGEEAMDIEMGPNKGKSQRSKIRTKKPSRAPAPPPTMKPEEFRRTFKIPSSILSRVKTFLPEMKNANEELLRLPDPSKISLESDSDEMDGAVAGPSGLCGASNTQKSANVKTENKTYVEMNLALLAPSDSDSSSDEDVPGNQSRVGNLKGLPVIDKKDTASSATADATTKQSSESVASTEDTPSGKSDEVNDSSGEKKLLITELN